MSTHTEEVITSDQSPSHRFGLAAMLLGMTFPVLFLLMLYPNGTHNIVLIAPIYLSGIFLIALGAFLISVFENGEPTSVTADLDNRKIVLQKTGLVARRELEFSFSDISKFRMEKVYDADGYDTWFPVMVLKDHDQILLPTTTTQDDLNELTLLVRQ